MCYLVNVHACKCIALGVLIFIRESAKSCENGGGEPLFSCHWKSIKWPWVRPFKTNVKIEQESNLVDNDHDSQSFFDAQEAKRRVH